MHEYIDIFLTFFKIGAINFGGGYAMLPLLEEELVNRKKWATKEQLLDYFAIGQCTPGVIAINVSTFIGYQKKGICGALCSTLGFITIPFVLIVGIAGILTQYSHLAIIQHALAGVRVCVFVLIIQTMQRLWKNSIVNRQTLGIYLAILSLCVLSFFLPFSIPNGIFVIAAGIFGFFFGAKGESL